MKIACVTNIKFSSLSTQGPMGEAGATDIFNSDVTDGGLVGGAGIYSTKQEFFSFDNVLSGKVARMAHAFT